LRRDTTYGLYVYAVTSNRIPPSHLLPSSFPFIRIVCGSDRPRLRRHYHCPGGNGGWHGTDSNTYESLAVAIADLISFRYLLMRVLFETTLLSPSLYVTPARIVVHSSCLFFLSLQNNGTEIHSSPSPG
jgi:hypothetical protein